MKEKYGAANMGHVRQWRTFLREWHHPGKELTDSIIVQHPTDMAENICIRSIRQTTRQFGLVSGKKECQSSRGTVAGNEDLLTIHHGKFLLRESQRSLGIHQPGKRRRELAVCRLEFPVGGRIFIDPSVQRECHNGKTGFRIGNMLRIIPILIDLNAGD